MTAEGKHCFSFVSIASLLFCWKQQKRDCGSCPDCVEARARSDMQQNRQARESKPEREGWGLSQSLPDTVPYSTFHSCGSGVSSISALYLTSKSSSPFTSIQSFGGIFHNTPMETLTYKITDINVNLLHKSNRILVNRAISCNISTAVIAVLRPDQSSADISWYHTSTCILLLN